MERTACLDGPLDPAALEVIGKPLLIDEADGWTTAFQEAIACGYPGCQSQETARVFSGPSSTTPWRLNAMRPLARTVTFSLPRISATFRSSPCSPTWQLLRPLGISHVERNGHHFFRGLDHLSADERQAALREEGLYRDRNGCIALDIDNGQIDVSSLDKPGFGFASPPDMERLIPPADWNYDMLRKKLDS